MIFVFGSTLYIHNHRFFLFAITPPKSESQGAWNLSIFNHQLHPWRIAHCPVWRDGPQGSLFKIFLTALIKRVILTQPLAFQDFLPLFKLVLEGHRGITIAVIKIAVRAMIAIIVSKSYSIYPPKYYYCDIPSLRNIIFIINRKPRG